MPSTASSPVCDFWLYAVVDDGYTLGVCLCLLGKLLRAGRQQSDLGSPPWSDPGAGVMLLVHTLGMSLCWKCFLLWMDIWSVPWGPQAHHGTGRMMDLTSSIWAAGRDQQALGCSQFIPVQPMGWTCAFRG